MSGYNMVTAGVIGFGIRCRPRTHKTVPMYGTSYNINNFNSKQIVDQ